MSDSTALAIVPRTLPEAVDLSTQLARARPILPKHVTDAPTALAIVLAGSELGLPPLTALRSIYLVEGRPVIASEVQLALVARAGVKWKWESESNDVTRAVLVLMRPGWEPHRHVYTMDDATRAGLSGKQNWQRHPAAMLRARCVTSAVRAYCPDILTGVLLPDEAEEIASERRAVVEGATAAPVTAESVSPAPEPPHHDPSWEREKGRFFVELRDLGYTYDGLAAFLEAHSTARPSAMPSAQRAKLLERLRTNPGPLREWLEAQREASEAAEAEVVP